MPAVRSRASPHPAASDVCAQGLAQVFDPEDTGEIDAERLQQMLLEDGESGRGYQDKEMEGEQLAPRLVYEGGPSDTRSRALRTRLRLPFLTAFMSIARDPGRATIAYEDYVAKLMASIEQSQVH